MTADNVINEARAAAEGLVLASRRWHYRWIVICAPSGTERIR